MKRQDFLPVVEAVATVAEHSQVFAVVPAYECLNFEGVSIRASNGSVFIEAQTKEDLKISGLLNAKNFVSLIRSLPEDEVVFEDTEEQLQLKSGNVEASLLKQVSPAIQYHPEDVRFSEINWNKVPDNFTDALTLVAPTTSRDYSLPVLTGVLVLEDKCITTDRYRITRVLFEGSKFESCCVLPIELVRLLLVYKGAVTHYYLKNDVVYFRLQEHNVILGATVLAGMDKFPARIIELADTFFEAEDNIELAIPESFTESLKRQQLVYKGLNEHDVTMQVRIDKKEFYLVGEQGGFGRVQEKIAFKNNTLKAPVSFRVSPSHLLDILKLYPSTKFIFNEGNRAIGIREDNLSYLVVVDF